jgi:hypothetical protein
MAIARRWLLHPSDERRELLFQLAAAAMRTCLLFLRTRQFKELAYLTAVAALILKYRHCLTPDTKFAIKLHILGIYGELAR